VTRFAAAVPAGPHRARLLAAVSAYLAERRWDFHIRPLIVIMLGLSVGCFIFSLPWLAKVHFAGEVE
jgi:hypothetical protein